MKNFKSLVDAKRVNSIRLEKIVDRLNAAYKANKDAPRYQATVGAHEVVVARSDTLASALKQDVDNLTE